MLTKPRCLIVDDEPDISELLSLTIEKMGIRTDCAGTLEDAKFRLSRDRYDLCLTDMRLPDGNGLDLMKHINLHYSGLPIAVITAFGSSDNAVSALKAGAFEYLSKPVSLQQLRPLVTTAIKPYQYGIQKENQLMLVGKSALINQARNSIDAISQNEAHALINGEPGSGKELSARLIHFNSARRERSFVKVNCAGISDKNAESQFFGASKNAENCSKKSKIGALEQAKNGTLFLDQVDKLPLSAQSLLSEALRENKENIRVLTATCHDLTSMMNEGDFNRDFYYQLNVLSLHMPPLRNIHEDIPLIVQHLLSKITAPAEDAPMLSACALAKLKTCHFENNVSELRNVLEKALTTHHSNIIKAEDLVIREKSLSLPDTNLDVPEMPLPDYLDHIERQAILKALNKTQQNKTAAAKLLGVSFRTLRYRLSKLGLSNRTKE